MTQEKLGTWLYRLDKLDKTLYDIFMHAVNQERVYEDATANT